MTLTSGESREAGGTFTEGESREAGAISPRPAPASNIEGEWLEYKAAGGKLLKSYWLEQRRKGK